MVFVRRNYAACCSGYDECEKYAPMPANDWDSIEHVDDCPCGSSIDECEHEYDFDHVGRCPSCRETDRAQGWNDWKPDLTRQLEMTLKPKDEPGELQKCTGCKYDPSISGSSCVCIHPHEYKLEFYEAPIDENGYPLCYRLPDDTRPDWEP